MLPEHGRVVLVVLQDGRVTQRRARTLGRYLPRGQARESERELVGRLVEVDGFLRDGVVEDAANLVRETLTGPRRDQPSI